MFIEKNHDEAKGISFNKIAVVACKDRIAATEVVERSLADAWLVVQRKSRKFAEDIDSAAVRRIDLD